MIFIPRELHVGYQDRSGTYTGKLAYIIYTDDQGKLRKETSWNSWRDKKIDPSVFENEPTEGFVLNKRAGGRAGSWGHDVRRETVRVYDPRGFEFEISVPNLLYILESANSIKGKGLEGEFVYGWDGTDLLLIPVDSPDYAECIAHRDVLYNKETIKAADLKVGSTYLNKDMQNYVYLGKFRAWSEPWARDAKPKSKGDHHYFICDNGKRKYLKVVKSLGNTWLRIVTDEVPNNFPELVSFMESQLVFCPIDPDKAKTPKFSFKEFSKSVENVYSSNFISDGKQYRIAREIKDWRMPTEHYEYKVTNISATRPEGMWIWSYPFVIYKDLQEVFDTYEPRHLDKYLQNGKLYRREF